MFLFFLLIFFGHTIASADLLSANIRYQYASKICNDYKSLDVLGGEVEILEASVLNFYRGVKSSMDLEVGLHPMTAELILSDEYFKALDECFGSRAENAMKWNTLTLLLIFSESAGKVAGYFGLPYGLSRVFSILGHLRNLTKGTMIGLKHLRVELTFSILSGLYMSYNTIQDSRLIFDENYAREKNRDTIKNEKLPELIKDHMERILKIDEAIGALSRNPSAETQSKIQELKEIKNRSNLLFERKIKFYKDELRQE